MEILDFGVERFSREKAQKAQKSMKRLTMLQAILVVMVGTMVGTLGFLIGRHSIPVQPAKKEFIDGVCFGVGINSFLKAKGQPFSLNAEGEEELWQFHVRHPGRPNVPTAIVPFEDVNRR